jgi:hypothetical protein
MLADLMFPAARSEIVMVSMRILMIVLQISLPSLSRILPFGSDRDTQPPEVSSQT